MKAGRITSILILAVLVSVAIKAVSWERMRVAVLRLAATRCIRTRVDREIQLMELALEEYKAENGRYPADAATQSFGPRTALDPESYILASRTLYRALSGDADGDPATSSPEDRKRYFEFKPSMLRSAGSGRITYIVDPWGNSYGYSTHEATFRDSSAGYNTGCFDLWSTRGGKTRKDRTSWAINW